MDINLWRSFTTVLLLVVFIGIVIWAYSRGNRKRFEEAAQLPFLDDQRRDAAIAAAGGGQHGAAGTDNNKRHGSPQ